MNFISKDTLFHVGDLEIESKSKYSYEAGGISVSECPSEWRRIARLSGEIFTFTRSEDESSFLDVFSLSDKQIDQIYSWAIGKDLIRKCTLYSFSYQDDEFDQEMKFSFSTLAEAEMESDGEHQIFEEEGYVPTSNLEKSLGISSSIGELRDHIICLYASTELDCDGVWWEEVLDPTILSAPRGVIFSSNLKNWYITDSKNELNGLGHQINYSLYHSSEDYLDFEEIDFSRGFWLSTDEEEYDEGETKEYIIRSEKRKSITAKFLFRNEDENLPPIINDGAADLIIVPSATFENCHFSTNYIVFNKNIISELKPSRKLKP